MSLRLFAFAAWIASAANFGSFPFSKDASVATEGQSEGGGGTSRGTYCPTASSVSQCKIPKILGQATCQQWPSLINVCYHTLWRQPSDIGPFDFQENCTELGDDYGLAIVGGGRYGATACSGFDLELSSGCAYSAEDWISELCFEGLDAYEDIALGDVAQSTFPAYDRCDFTAPIPWEGGKSIRDLVEEGNIETNVIEASGKGLPRGYWAKDLCLGGESGRCAGERVTNVPGATRCRNLAARGCPRNTYYEVVDEATDERAYCERQQIQGEKRCRPAATTSVCGAPSPPPLSPAPPSAPPALPPFTPPPSTPPTPPSPSTPPGPCAALDADGMQKIALKKDDNGNSIDNNCNKFALWEGRPQNPRNRNKSGQDAAYLATCVTGYLYYEDTGMYHKCWVNAKNNCARSNAQSDKTSPADC